MMKSAFFGAKLVTLIACLSVLSGCGLSEPPTIQQETLQHHVLILPGVAGPNRGLRALTRAIEAEHPGVSAEIWDWTAIEPPDFAEVWPFRKKTLVINISDEARNRRTAALLATQLEAWRVDHEDVELTIISKSGGAGIVSFAMEVVSPDFRFRNAIMLVPAVSPSFDFTPLADHVSGSIYSYYSPSDWFVSKVLTTRYGTMDRKFGPSAGFAGIQENRHLQGKLRQLKWTPAMIFGGNLGGHEGCLARGFVRKFLLGVVKDEPQSEWMVY